MNTRPSSEALPEAAEIGGEDAAAGSPGRARRIGFRVVTILTSLLFLLFFGFAMTEVVLMWLPGDTLSSILEEPFAEMAIHRSHFFIVGLVAWAAVLTMLVQLRKPERRVASMALLVATAVGATVVYGLSGSLGESLAEEGIILVPVLLAAFLHPRRRELVRRPQFDRSMTTLSAVAAIPWVAFIIENGRMQVLNAAGDSHAEMEHWATAALMATIVVVASFLGSSDHAGWRLPASIAAASSALFGVHSLVFPDLPSGLSTFWAAAAVIWGLAFAAMIVTRSRGTDGRTST